MATTYIPHKRVAVTVNYQRLMANVGRWAEKGLEEALEELQARAQAKAPVRDVFRHGRQTRPPEAVPRGKRRHYADSSRDRFLKQVGAQSRGNREVRTITGKSSSGKETFTRIRGNAYSYQPVLGTRKAPFTGEFRRVRIDYKGQATISDTERWDHGKSDRKLQAGSDTYKNLLNAHGRQELRRINRVKDVLVKAEGRKMAPREINAMLIEHQTKANARGRGARAKGASRSAKAWAKSEVALSNQGSQLLLGGRLRSEIYATPVTRRGDVFYGDVVSPTFYAEYQEYGTSHHRAQPYMRPALYEMRGRLPQRFKSAIRKERGA